MYVLEHMRAKSKISSWFNSTYPSDLGFSKSTLLSEVEARSSFLKSHRILLLLF